LRPRQKKAGATFALRVRKESRQKSAENKASRLNDRCAVTCRSSAGFAGPRRDEAAYPNANLLTRRPRVSGGY
jgi:hypothetical protein